MKHQIVKIETNYSENGKLANRTFSNILSADIAVLQATSDKVATDLSYDKTDFVITWDDGNVLSGTLEANRHTTFSSHINDLNSYYKRPYQEGMFYTREQWTKRKADWREFVENRQI